MFDFIADLDPASLLIGFGSACVLSGLLLSLIFRSEHPWEDRNDDA